MSAGGRPADTDFHEADAAIEDYLDRLRGHLGGTDARDGADVLDEVRDHLLSHVEFQVDQGVPRAEAVAVALAEFGSADGLGSAMRFELARPKLRRLNVSLFGLGLTLGVGWMLLFEYAPPVPWTMETRPPIMHMFDLGAERAAISALLLAALSLLLVVVPGRFPALNAVRASCQRWSVRAGLGAVLCGGAAALQTAGYLLIRTVMGPESLSWPVVGLLGAATLAAAPLVVRPLRAIVATG